jgi:hypothetical protein
MVRDPMYKLLAFATAVVVALIAVAALTLLDRLLPADLLNTTVYASKYSAAAGSEIIYDLPLSGGDIAYCSVSEDTARTLAKNSEVIVATSAIFGRCTGVYPFVEPQGINRTAFINNAIRSAYGGVYANLDDLRRDYPGFTPRIRNWGSHAWFLPDHTRRYSVQLPKALVILKPTGEASAFRACGVTEGDCQVVALAYTR